jgi:hypothetical protein
MQADRRTASTRRPSLRRAAESGPGYPLAGPDTVRVLLLWVPTAMQASAEVQDTALRELPPAPRLGLGARDQVVPFHDSMRVWPKWVLELR